MVMYNNYRPFKSWLNKVKNIDTIKAMSNSQGRKKRIGNIFMVIGANGYIGWATICQLVYKIKDCHIVAVDKNYKSRSSITVHYNFDERVETLKKYFQFSIDQEKVDMSNYKECESILGKYKPDFIINLADGNKKENLVLNNLLKLGQSHLIVSTDYNSKTDFSLASCKVTEFKTTNVVGLCNLVTLIDPKLSTCNNSRKLINKIIYDAVNKKIVKSSFGSIAVLSLEDFTRSIIKVIRKGQEKQYNSFYAVEKNISKARILNIVESTLKDFNIQIKTILNSEKSNIVQIKDKKKFLRLIDKHRPPVEYLISYSCKNFLVARNSQWQ